MHASLSLSLSLSKWGQILLLPDSSQLSSGLTRFPSSPSRGSALGDQADRTVSCPLSFSLKSIFSPTALVLAAGGPWEEGSHVEKWTPPGGSYRYPVMAQGF
jgi:hypothetical protein